MDLTGHDLPAPAPMELPTELRDVDLDMLAYDIADTMDRGGHGHGEIADCDLRPFLAELLIKALNHARATADLEDAEPAEPPRNVAGDR